MKINPRPDGLHFAVKVVPNSSHSCMAGTLGDTLKIRIAQPPEDGKANRAVLALLAQALEIPPSQVALVSGHASARKTIRITGLTSEQLQARLFGHIEN